MELVNRALSNHQLTLRGADRAMRLSWTLADLAGRVSPTEQDVHQGIEMRTRIIWNATDIRESGRTAGSVDHTDTSLAVSRTIPVLD